MALFAYLVGYSPKEKAIFYKIGKYLNYKQFVVKLKQSEISYMGLA